MKRFLPIVVVLAYVLGCTSVSTGFSGATAVFAKGISSKGSLSKAAHAKSATPKAAKSKTHAAKTGKTQKDPKPKKTASASTTSATGAHPSTYCNTCARDAKGRILRGDAAKTAFKNQTGFPRGRPGYMIDHVVPLACGGRDTTANMQWQTIAAGKVKDETERSGCRR